MTNNARNGVIMPSYYTRGWDYVSHEQELEGQRLDGPLWVISFPSILWLSKALNISIEAAQLLIRF